MTIKPFEPSCGSETMLVYDICEHCERDRATWPVEQGGRDDLSNGCPILCIMGMNGRHPAWVIDNGELRCLKYVPEGQEVPEDDTETLDLFGEDDNANL